MTRPVTYLNTETGGLRPTDRPWEVALVTDLPDGSYEQRVWHVVDFRPADADPITLDLAHFYDRHPLHMADQQSAAMALQLGTLITGPDPDVPVAHRTVPEVQMVIEVERALREHVVVGCNPGFDTYRALERAFGRHGYAPTWHYRPICATSYAAGALGLPIEAWNNREVGAALGIDRDGYGPAHSGLADAHYARALERAAREHVRAQQVSA